jgi:hypothetical protein
MLNTTTSLDQKNRIKKRRKSEKRRERDRERERQRERENEVIVAAICLQCNNYFEHEKCPSIVII